MRLEPAARYQACTLVLYAPDFAFMDTLQLPARIAPATASAAGGVADADADLMLAYAGGDGDGFALLYERHKGGVYRYFLRSLRDGGLAEELAQDVWASVIRGRAGYRPEAKFTTWLYRLAHNRLIDHYRRSSVVVFSPLEPDTDDGETGQHHPSPAPGPEDVTHHRAAARRLVELVELLPPNQREAFLLQAEGGLSLEEIAEATGGDFEAVKSRLRYALKKLRDGMKGYL